MIPKKEPAVEYRHSRFFFLVNTLFIISLGVDVVHTVVGHSLYRGRKKKAPAMMMVLAMILAYFSALAL